MRFNLLFLSLLTLAALSFGCVSSKPIDVQLAEQNRENIVTTNEGTVELLDLLDRAKAETPDAGWATEWDAGARNSHELQIKANAEVADEVVKRAQANNAGE